MPKQSTSEKGILKAAKIDSRRLRKTGWIVAADITLILPSGN
jgi:hypothetical protein